MKLISHLTNIRYLTGFEGSSGLLLLGKKNILLTDFRYREIAKQLAGKGGRIDFEFIEMNAELDLNKLFGRLKNIEFESHHVTVNQLKHWKKSIKGKNWSPIKSPIEKLRAQKDKDEIKFLKHSQKINEQTLKEVHKQFKKGITELEIAWLIKSIGHDFGADDISFEPIVAFGSHSAIPHHHNTTRKLKNNEAVLIDMGMKYKGYCSDMTRTFFFGKAASEFNSIYELVLQSQLEAIKEIKSGTKASSVDKAARKIMGEHSEYFGHSFGHGIGLDVHESPNLSSRSKDTLKENMIVTAEPGIYLEGKFGVRIEDMGRVSAKGYDNFTKFPKQLKDIS